MSKRLSLGSVAAAATLVLTLGLVSYLGASPAGAAATPAPPFNQCPAVGLDTGCGLLIYVDSTGHVGVLQDPSQGPLDGIEDTLIGVVNDGPTPLASLPLSSGTNIFAFDSDGLCAASPQPSGCPFGPTGYEGPGVSFGGISGDQSSGTVNFSPPVPRGGTAYFSLEEQLGLVPPNNVVPGPPNAGAIKIADSANEPVVAVNPADPRNIVVAYNHLDTLGNVHCGYAVSHNGGASYVSSGDLPFPSDRGGKILTKQGGDPSLAFTPTGKLYFACIAGFDDGSPDGTTTAIYTAVSTTGGVRSQPRLSLLMA